MNDQQATSLAEQNQETVEDFDLEMSKAVQLVVECMKELTPVARQLDCLRCVVP